MKTFFRTRLMDLSQILFLAILLASTVVTFGQPTAMDYPANKAVAEQFYAEGSYAKANEIYGKADVSSLSQEETRWVDFRLADTQWRSAAATDNSDTTKLDEARDNLEKQIRDLMREGQHDRVWAEVQESLGDFFWTRHNNYNWYNDWNSAWPHYQAALDWWAGQGDLDLAREHYLKIAWRMSQTPNGSGLGFYWGNRVPLEIFENAAKIAKTDEDKAHAHYLIAMTLREQGDWEQRARVPKEFEAAIQPGRKTDWYDDAVFNYAQWMEQNGNSTMDKNGNWSSQPDYVKALALFQQFTNEFAKGESRYLDQARNEIQNITAPQINVGVGNIFLPDSEIQYSLNWRNVKQIQLALFRVNLTRAVNFPAESGDRHEWLETIGLNTLEKIKSWTCDTHDAGIFSPSNEVVQLDGKLQPGAYVVEAQAGGKSSRELILVTDAALVLKNSGRQALVYFCNALDSAPLTNATVKLWESWWADSQWHSRSFDGTTDTNGIAVFTLEHEPDSGITLFASAVSGARQAFSVGNGYWQRENSGAWRIYAFTDRPAYRPKETADWKFIARRYNGSVYSTPANETIEYEITDPRGTKVKSDKIKLNEFGSAWGSFDLTEKNPLGEYRVTFWDEGRHNEIGNATLFRLEEYKLPEFKVNVQTPEQNGQKKTFRLGETVEAAIQADYYFGGPVANADVEVLVHQKPFLHFWREPRAYPWFYDDMDSGNSPYGRWRGYYGGDQIITNATLKTDATGKATLTFATPQNSGQDFEYNIEARVTDSSRREITGNGTVRVTRQRYYIYANPAHNLYRPQDKVTVNFKALDANDQPVQTGGEVKVTRDYWHEIWLAPDGREVKGDELKQLEAENKIWPPAPARPDQKDWQLKFRGYEHDEIITRSLKTDTNGEAELSFTPEREGYYRVAWSGEDVFTNQAPQLINADTTVWVAKNSATELGYRTGGVEIIADKDTFRVSGIASVMLVTPTADRYVLFTVEGEDLYHYQLVHLDGTVKLVNLAVDEKYVPNIFLGATLVNDRQIFTDTTQIVVPPLKNFLNVEVKPDRAQYQPRDEGTLTVTTKNDEGKPVSAEVALSLADESVFYIQNDYAGDPRQFYFGTKRAEQIQTQSTMNQKSYAKLVEWKNNQLIDDEEKIRLEEQKREEMTQLKDGRFAWKKDFNGIVATDDLDEAQKDKSDGFGGGGAGGLRNVTASGAIGGSTFAVNSAAVEMPAGMSGIPPALNGVPVMGDLTRAKMPEGQFPGASAGEEPAVIVRSDFRSTIFWQPDIVTDKNGNATVKVKYPDSLTSWRATARAVTTVNQFGIADATTRSRQPLIVRLEAPRFFVVGDTVTISAVVNNNTENEMTVQPALELGGVLSNVKLEPMAALKVPANGESRADWVLKISQPGDVKLKVTARGGKYADAMEKTFTAYEHGIEKFISESGKTRGDDTTVKLVLPHERKEDSTSLIVQVTPSMAVTMLDALPYLINYPYGCTEQTMSRFLPTVITAKTLRDLGLQPEDVMSRVFGGIETNTAAAPHPQGKKDLDEMNKMTQASLDRLYDFQHSDGGWGWWKEGDSDHWMTAYVVWGLSLARDAGVEIKDDVLRRGAKYLDEHLVDEEENPDIQAWMLHAYSAYILPYKNNSGLLGRFIGNAEDNLWNRRDQLNAYTRALFALAENNLDNHARAKILIENLENGVIRDTRSDQSVLTGNNSPMTNSQTSTVLGTAHWGNDGIYWHWSDGGVEATAFALRALLAIDPTNELVEPVSNWLIKNRRGAQWNNTRDTAIVVLALNDYLRASGELHPDMAFEVYMNGMKVADRKISGADVFNAPSQFAIDPKLIQDTNEIRIVRTGDSPLYFSANAKFFSTEEPIAPAGNEIFVKREYYKLAGRPTLLKGYVYDREPLRDGETVTSGERVETVLTIEAKNNYEYLMFEDLKPAGFEAVEVRSGENLYARQLMAGAVARKFGTTSVHEIKAGETLSSLAKAYGVSVSEIENANSGIDPKRLFIGSKLTIPATQSADFETGYTGDQRWVYQELRDRQVALFIDHLPQGVWEIRYNFRAETPGQFHALPVVGRAMYVPEIRCNSAELRVNIVDKTP
jgi:alpha-2-macroglobulin